MRNKKDDKIVLTVEEYETAFGTSKIQPQKLGRLIGVRLSHIERVIVSRDKITIKTYANVPRLVHRVPQEKNVTPSLSDDVNISGDYWSARKRESRARQRAHVDKKYTVKIARG